MRLAYFLFHPSGLGMFGIKGFIIGPVIAALFVTVLDILGLEFQKN